LNATARHAIGQELTDSVVWALGDGSPDPLIEPQDVAALAEAADGLDEVTYQFFGANLGSSGGQNRLAQEANADTLLVLNPDTYPSPTALSQLLRPLTRRRVAIVEARQLPLEHPKTYDLATGETSWASGSCMLIRKDVFDAVQGFDDQNFLLHGDDVDLSWRVRAQGHKVIHAPLASVFHDKRPAEDRPWPAPDSERHHAVLGRLMLATRWCRPDIVDQTMQEVQKNGDEVQRAALEEFRRRSAAGSLPDAAPDPSVAEFIAGEYAVHRF
jgi:GT2 family glycosyltransferase